MNGLDELFLSFEIANDFATQKQFFFKFYKIKWLDQDFFQMEYHLNRDSLTCIKRNKTETGKNLPMNLFEDGSTVESGPVNYHVDRERSPIPK